DEDIGQCVQFGALRVKTSVCYARPSTEAANTDAFVEVDEITLQGEVKRIFSGWMYAASPGLHGVEHPIYDIWLTDCKGPEQTIVSAAPTATPTPAPAPPPVQKRPPPQKQAAPRPPPPAHIHTPRAAPPAATAAARRSVRRIVRKLGRVLIIGPHRCISNDRFAPGSGHRRRMSACPLRATSRHRKRIHRHHPK